MSGVIVITGAVGALGSSLSRYLVARGYGVAGVGLRRHEERLGAIEEELGAAFAGFPLEEDSFAAWEATMGAIESRLGPVSGATLVAGGWRGGRRLAAAGGLAICGSATAFAASDAGNNHDYAGEQDSR